MIPTLFQIGPLPIHSFGLLMVLAFLAAWRMFANSLESAGKRVELAERVITWAAFGGIVGARAGYLFSFPTELFEHPLATIFGGAGFVFHWGLIGGILASWLLLRRENEAFLSMADVGEPALAIGYAVGRIGCQLSGDGDYGKASDLPWAMGYPLGVVPTPPGMQVHPTPMYETFAALLIAYVLSRPASRRAFPYTGQLFALYLVLSAIARFAVEYLRVEPIVLPPFTQAQVVSALLCLAGGALFFRARSSRTVVP